MKHIALVSVMTPFPFSIEASEPLSRARATMEAHSIRHLPVTIDGRLAGIISERDIALAAGPDPIPPADDVPVLAVAQLDAYAVKVETPLDEVLLQMASRHIGSALVTRHGKLVGIFTATDACRALAEQLRTQASPGGEVA